MSFLTITRWPGASLILIRGHRNLHECAYIGDDSSEELEELMDIVADKGIKTDSHTIDNPSNNPNLLKKSSPDVRFHDPEASAMIKNYTFAKRESKETVREYDVSAGKDMRKLLNEIRNKAESFKKPKEKKKNTKYTDLKDWIAQRQSYTKNSTTNTTEAVAEIVTEVVTDFVVTKVVNEHLEEDSANVTPKKKHHATFDNVHKAREVAFGRQEEDNIVFEK